MSDDLPTLPGSPTMRPRFCTPVRDAADPARCGVVVGTWPNSDTVRVCWTWDNTVEDVPVERLLFDLTDATGRAHAAWWLAMRCGSTIPGDACWWCWYPGGGGWAVGPMHPDPAKHAHVFPRVDPVGVADIGQQTWHSVPALATLDPNDPRLLPDGSRLVDALALRLVCLHVAGLEVPRG